MPATVSSGVKGQVLTPAMRTRRPAAKQQNSVTGPAGNARCNSNAEAEVLTRSQQKAIQRAMTSSRVITIALLLAAGALCANAESLNFDDLIQELNETVLTNLDLPAPSDWDETKLKDIALELQAQFQGEYALRLAPVRAAAVEVLPILEQDNETQALAAWLRTGMESLGTADVLRVEIPAPALQLPQPLPELPAPRLSLTQPVWPLRPRPTNWPAGAQLYVHQLKPVFVAEGVPAELVWLAEVESGFQPQARSRVGAAGLFQLMPDTAELLGLSLRPVDDRLVPMKNGRAAAQYLKYLHDKFADWQLALAAYNGGEGRVRRLLDQSRSRTYDAIAARLPAETQVYVSKVEATILRREGLVLGELSLPGAIATDSGWTAR